MIQMIRGAPFARFYDAVMSSADRVGFARRRRVLAAHARGRVLEIGAGTGLEFQHYASATSLVAIEPDMAMIERAKARAAVSSARIALVAADARALPFRDGTFDTAISALAFCTIPEPERAALEMRRVLRASGVAYLLEHVRAVHRPLAFIQSMLTPLWRRIASGCHLDRRTADLLRCSSFDVVVEHPALDGTLVELIAHPSNARGRQPTHVGGSARPQPAFSNAAQASRRRRSSRR